MLTLYIFIFKNRIKNLLNKGFYIKIYVNFLKESTSNQS